MTRTLSGRETLQRLDRTIAETRRALADAIDAKDTADTRRAEVRDGQVEAYRALADIRLDLLREEDARKTFDDLHREAEALLDAQDGFVAEQAKDLAAASEAIADLEKKRGALAAELDASVEAYETRVSEIQGKLLTDTDYQTLVETAEASASVVSRAEQKLNLAREDRRDKGAPYKADSLFMYLWKRKFRTPSYKASPPIRFLDHWVARLCKYDIAHLNYARLVELPDRLQEHVSRVTQAYEAAVAALETAEQDALDKGGALALGKTVETARDRLQSLEPEIEAAEAHHRATAERHESALTAGTGPAQKARKLLEEGLKAASFPDLRLLAAETIELEDDRIVDALVKLRAEEMSLELEADRMLRLPTRRRKELETLERLRRRFKRDRYDSPYATFKTSAVDMVLRGLLRGELDADRAMRQFGRSVRHRKPRTHRGFGGRSRRDTLDLPDVLGDVLWEIAKESSRSSRGGSPWSSGRTRRRAPPRSFPSSRGGSSRGGGSRSGKRGGFKTGGGF